MSKSYLILFILLFVFSCGKNGSQSETSCDMLCEASEYTLPAMPEDQLPVEASTFETNLVLVNFDEAQATKVQSAAEIIKRVISSQEFKTAVLNHRFEGKRSFANNNGLSNQQIYDRILIGAEKLTAAKNNAMDVELELYFQNTTTIGYTYPSTTRIWMNTKYFNSYTPTSVSSNLMHEWLHKLGFGHDAAATAIRPYSVPYAIGYLVRDLAARKLTFP